MHCFQNKKNDDYCIICDFSTPQIVDRLLEVFRIRLIANFVSTNFAITIALKKNHQKRITKIK